MKIRHGFVSNSSSSSFLVAFPSYPKSAQEVKDLLFGDREKFSGPYWEEEWSALEIAERVWNDMKKQIPNNKNVIMDRMHNVIIDSMDNYKLPPEDPNERWNYDYDWDSYSYDNDKVVMEFMDNHQGHYFFHFTYADDGGSIQEAAMEHGDLFSNLPHLRSSNH